MCINKQIHRYSYKIIIFLLIIFFASCSQTRYVPDGKHLINSVNVNVDNKAINKDELKQQITQKENLRILGIVKFHLGIYNLSRRNKDNGWMKRIGEPPAIFDDYKNIHSINNIKIFLANKGYYDAVVTDSICYKKKKKIDLYFNVTTGNVYTIRNYNTKILDPHLETLINNNPQASLIKKNAPFDIEVLNKERNRLSNLLKNKGFFNFTPDYIKFEADSSISNRQVDLWLIVADADLQNKSDSLVRHKKYIIDNYTYKTNFSPNISSQLREVINLRQDTLLASPYSFIYNRRLAYKTNLLTGLNHFQDSIYYSLSNVERSFRSLSALQQFKVIDINFKENKNIESNDSIGYLDCTFNLSPLSRQAFSIDIEGTNSSGNLGIAGSFNYTHRNLFKGAEILKLNLRVARERQQTLISNNVVNFNTQEYGIEASITTPKFLSPVLPQQIFKYSIPQTIFTAGYNYQQRPDYTRSITTFKYGYKWKSKPTRTYLLNILDWNLVHMADYNTDFINSIQDLYIKSSYTDHLITALNFTVTNNPQELKQSSYHYLKWSVESAGNLLSAFAKLTNWKEYEYTDHKTGELEKYYRAGDIRFAQYLKGDIDFRYGYKIDKYNSIVTRAFLGVAFPYGNFDVTPFERRYFSGGANSIRAWQVRTLGPGSYAAAINEYPNQSADIKIEANLEYRFKLVSFIESALFLDVGNIWAINHNDNREGAIFYFDKFYKQLALGTGTGLRFDFSYFVFRLDLGMKLIDPSLPEGRKFIVGNYPINANHFNLNFAIGYPF